MVALIFVRVAPSRTRLSAKIIAWLRARTW